LIDPEDDGCGDVDGETSRYEVFQFNSFMAFPLMELPLNQLSAASAVYLNI